MEKPPNHYQSTKLKEATRQTQLTPPPLSWGGWGGSVWGTSPPEMWQGVREGPPPPYTQATQAPPPAHPLITRTAPRHKTRVSPRLSTARRIARVGCRAMPTRRGTLSRPRVGRDPRKGQGEIPGAEKSAPDLAVIPGRTRKASPKSGTHIMPSSLASPSLLPSGFTGHSRGTSHSSIDVDVAAAPTSFAASRWKPPDTR